MNNLKEEMKNNFEIRPVFDDLEKMSAQLERGIMKSKSELAGTIEILKASCKSEFEK